MLAKGSAGNCVPRFYNPLASGKTIFGDGSYSQNVNQSGIVQPQAGYSPSTIIVSPSSQGGESYTWLSTTNYVPAGTKVTHLGTYHTTAGITQKLIIARLDSGTNFTIVARKDITTTVGGWQYTALDTPYIIPNDGKTYYIGLQCDSGFWTAAGTPSYYYGGQALSVGTQYTFNGPGNNNPAAVAYKSEVITADKQVVVVTGAATVAPDAVTGASVVMCDALVVDGASATLTPSTNSKGLIILAKSGVRVMNGGKINIDLLGKAGNFGNITPWDLVPAALRAKLKLSALTAYTLLGEGASGGARGSGTGRPGTTGTAASSMQAGGGGGGGPDPVGGAVYCGAGGKGGPCCGGAGGGGSWSGGAVSNPDAGSYGGPAGNGVGDQNGAGGGAGNPVGTNQGGGTAPRGAGGGFLLLCTPSASIASGCIVSADGAQGGNAVVNGGGGAGAGGGIVLIITNSGGYSNAGTIRAAGGVGGTTPGGYNNAGGAGGAGSVNTYTV